MGPSTVGGVAELLARDLGHPLEPELLAGLDQESAADDWAGTGLLDASGRAVPLNAIAHGRSATVARAAGVVLGSVAHQRFGATLRLDGAQVLGRRAALAGTSYRTSPDQVSRGGSARLLRATDGWWVLNLARPSDLDMVPALVEDEVEDPWLAVERWSARITAQAAVDRATLLDLPAARLGETPPPNVPWQITSTAARHASTTRRVVNLGSLWAAPLAAHVLGRLGFEVIHVESVQRRDASRWGDPDFYAELRAGAEVRTIDLAATHGRDELARVVGSADVVIEASRPRALEGLGISHANVMADAKARTWLQITGHGPDQPHRVGFGDDAAVAGGIVMVRDDGTPDFLGDAVADPLTGLLGALAVAASHSSDRSTIVRTSLAGSAAYSRTPQE
ncbi:hypothetical protein BJ980_002467 [Nocardioides daedukensis]|uniref:CoA transferase n=1 Tax=Nocardioides daedukensis TaxID=634462 RepID=A0A7Y9S4G1_9ACTN|nr:CoA transferase [Nocardioides daedukensis]NYG59544.1 hypothetical protein [Nocardioides daedukensis]